MPPGRTPPPAAYSTQEYFTDSQGNVYEVWHDPATGANFNVSIGTAPTQSGMEVVADYRTANPGGGQSSAPSSPDRYGTTGYDQLGAGGYSSTSASAPAPSGGGGGMAPAPAASGGYGAPAPAYAPGPAYANGQASRIPVTPAPPPTTTGFARSPWSVSMGEAIGSFDPKGSPPSFSLPQPLPNQPSRPPAMTIDEFMTLRDSLGR